MDNSIIRILAVFAGIVLLYFILKMALSWVRDFLGQGVAISKKVFILTGIVIAVCFWQFPEDTHLFFQALWEGLIEAYYSLNSGETLISWLIPTLIPTEQIRLTCQ